MYREPDINALDSSDHACDMADAQQPLHFQEGPHILVPFYLPVYHAASISSTWSNLMNWVAKNSSSDSPGPKSRGEKLTCEPLRLLAA
jgi:hypothetical protein